jgi:arylsulfatase A-like enzyme/cytochrome c-type biogenesis protein CcmH/NrfG
MNRITNLALALTIAAGLTHCGKEAVAPAATVKAINAPVILISIDTLRSDHLPMYGYSGVQTPALDSFRRDSILFQNAWSHCPMTLPSHVSMLTGLLPTQHDVRNNLGYRFHASRVPTVPSILKQHGYTTGAAVSSFVLRGETGLAEAFDWYEDSIRPDAGSAFIDYQRSGVETAKLATAWIELNKAKPFFLFLHLYEPHVPYAPPEPFASQYQNRYDGEIASADHIVGEFLDQLKKQGIYDRAVIVLTSDHGEGFGDHGEEQHSILLYRELLQVPLVLKLPANERAGTTVSAPAQLADIAPTFLEILGIEGPKMTGSSLLGLSAVRPLYAETMYPRIQLGWSELTSVIEHPYQLIDSPRPELYDLSKDPGEKNDLAATERRKFASMRKWLAAQQTPLRPLEQVDAETSAKLTALGYIGSPATRGGDLPNPRDAIRLLPEMQRAFKLHADGRQTEAIGALQKMTAEHPEMIELWVKLGEVYSASGMFQQSANAYQEAIRRTPLFAPEYVFSAAEVLIKAGDLAKAEQHAALLMKEQPANGHELMARIAMARNDLKKAEAEARLSVETDRRFEPKRLILVAEVFQHQGRFAETLQTLDSAETKAKSAGLGAVYRLDFLRGDTLARMNRFAEAEAAYRREISAFPNDGQAYANLAVLYIIGGRSREAGRVFENLVAGHPTEVNYLLAIRTFEAVEDVASAQEWRRRMQQRRPAL